jgi:CheY-like chemotaxis protein
VLLVEDERVSRRALATLLGTSGYPTQAVASAEEALEAIEVGRTPAIAVVDLDLPGINGLDLIARIEKLYPDVFSVLVTGADSDRLNLLLSGRRVALLRKPVDFNQLLLLLDEQRMRSPLVDPLRNVHSCSHS